MDDDFILGYLEELAQRIGLKIRCEPIPEEEILVTGGLCRIRGEPVVLINRKTTRKERIDVFIQAIRKFDLAGIYILPAIRKLLENTELPPEDNTRS